MSDSRQEALNELAEIEILAKDLQYLLAQPRSSDAERTQQALMMRSAVFRLLKHINDLEKQP